MFKPVSVLLTVIIFSNSLFIANAQASPGACTTGWGWPGFVRGSNPWGAVLKPIESSALNNVLSGACATACVHF